MRIQVTPSTGLCQVVSRRARKLVPLPTIDDWRLTALLGKGATASVYAAAPMEQPADVESDYAMKVLHEPLWQDAAARLRMAREAAVARDVTHPNLTAVLAACLQKAPFFLLMPRLRGATLAEVLAVARRCNVPRALWIARQVAEALSAMHGAGWLHLDVKPANIMLDLSGHCTLIDLDLALPRDVAANDAGRELHGTLAYSAPELFTSRTNRQPASDVYSLGVMLYEMLCGCLPFRGDSPARFVEAHLNQIPPSIRTHQSDLPVELSRLVTRMLAKLPERRPTTDGELQDELARLEIATFGVRNVM